MKTSTQREKLGWVEFSRGCAALVVFVSHSFYADVPSSYSNIFLWGRWGVCFFFVLSGFIIAHAHWADLNTPSRAPNFYWRRFVRIFPTYWLALAAFLFVRNYLGNPDHRIHAGIFEIVGNIAMWPTISELLLSMAWTLRHELLFYALFSALILGTRLGIAVLACWLLLLLWGLSQSTSCEMLTVAADRCMQLNSMLPARNPALLIVTLNVNLYFFVGIGLAVCSRAGKINTALLVTMTGTAVTFIAYQVFDAVYILALMQAFAIVFCVTGAIAASERYRAPQLAHWFGAISYPFYLLHVTAMLVAHGLLKRAPIEVPWQFTVLLALVLSLLASHAVAFLFENRVRIFAAKFRRLRTAS